MNNAQRRRQERFARLEPELVLKYRRTSDGHRIAVPLGYMSRDERADFLKRATSPL